MKKIFRVIISILIFIPFIKVNALECYNEIIDVNNITSFTCNKVEGDSLTFTFSDKDLKDYFEYSINSESKEADITINKTIKFESNIQIAIVKISDGISEDFVEMKNNNYTTTTTTTTTTTSNQNIKVLTVTLDPNDGTTTDKKTCNLTGTDTTCLVTLPNINKTTFNGWGTAKSCKEGNSGTIKVEKDITYYACYTDNENINEEKKQETETQILLKTLLLSNKDTNETIDFGTFSIKKTEYSFKVLNDVENIDVLATTDEGITVDIIGNENLLVGENKILIKLTDRNNNTNEYTLNVQRLEVGETINNIHYLKSLVVGGYNLDFDKEKMSYSLTISSDIDKLEITAIPEIDSDSVEIIGNEELIDGSSISINVNGDNEETTVYMINVTKESSMNYLLIGAIGIILLLIILLIILIIIKSNKKKQNMKNNSKPEVIKDAKKETLEVLNI